MSPAAINTVWAALGRADDYLSTIADARRDRSPIHGYGLFAGRSRSAGDHVVTLDGQIVAVNELPEALFTLEWNAISPHSLLVRAIRTSYGYINHDRQPNLTIADDGRSIFTTRSVAEGEEFTLNYLAQPLPQAYLDAPQETYLTGG